MFYVFAGIVFFVAGLLAAGTYVYYRDQQVVDDMLRRAG